MPRAGGDTLYANLYAAYDALDERTKSDLETLKAVHDLDASRMRAGEPPMSEKQRAAAPPVEHPMVTTHPRTGRKILYISRHVSHVAGMERAKSDALLAAQESAAEQAKASIDTPLPADFDADEVVLKELCDILEQVVRHNSEMAGAHFAWVPKLARDVRAGQYETWRQLLEQTKLHVAAIKKVPESVYEMEVINLGELDIVNVHDDLETIFKHVENGEI